MSSRDTPIAAEKANNVLRKIENGTPPGRAQPEAERVRSRHTSVADPSVEIFREDRRVRYVERVSQRSGSPESTRSG
jgi:hypothetical protein